MHIRPPAPTYQRPHSAPPEQVPDMKNPQPEQKAVSDSTQAQVKDMIKNGYSPDELIVLPNGTVQIDHELIEQRAIERAFASPK